MAAATRNIRVFLKPMEIFEEEKYTEIRIPDTAVDRIVGVVCVCDPPVGKYGVDMYSAAISGLEQEKGEFNPERNNNLLYFNVPNSRKDMRIQLRNVSAPNAPKAAIQKAYFICAEGLNLNESIVCSRMAIRQGALGDNINMGFNFSVWDSPHSLMTYNASPKGFCGAIAMSENEYTVFRSNYVEKHEIDTLKPKELNVLNTPFYPYNIFQEEMITYVPKTPNHKLTDQERVLYKVHSLMMIVLEERRKLKYCE